LISHSTSRPTGSAGHFSVESYGRIRVSDWRQTLEWVCRMSLSPGTSIGSYEITGSLGAGGMGEVYRARDGRLGRDVAIKILPALWLADPDRRGRFDREARLLASLNHPHIGTIYGFEEHDGVQALVLELVEGLTLADVIVASRRGGSLDPPIPIDQALTIASQIADALDAAHERGIVHRDLKPANIKITPDGRVKVLDFGLAKVAAGEDVAIELTHSPTITFGGTRAGVLLGTAAYMSPEQARGRAVDKRTDIWAFGCVLYEMLTGRVALPGETVTDTLAAIVQRDPDWHALPKGTPSGVQWLLKRCLEKDVSRRLRDAADVKIHIDDLLNEPATNDQASAAAAKPRFGRGGWLSMVLVGATAALAAGAGGWMLKPGTAPEPTPVARLTVSLPPGDTLGVSFPSVALSPDGRTLAYTANRARSNSSQLFVRAIDSLDVAPLSGTEGATAPFFSPDGRWIGFFAQGKLKKVLATGGGVEALCDAASGLGGSWGTDDTIYFAPFNTSGIWRVSASGGMPREVTRLDRKQGEVSHRWPQVLPGGKAVLFTVWTGPGWDEKHLVMQVADTSEHRTLVRGCKHRSVRGLGSPDLRAGRGAGAGTF
jgi:serine/threonine protein kinase